MIRTEHATTASPTTVHRLLVDVDAWALWSPHVAEVRAGERKISHGWEGATRAFFSPGHTEMVVDEVRPDGGYRWHSSVGPWRLDYDNAVTPAADGSTVTFSARLSGPGAGVIEPLVAPLSARGQRRRIARLARLAELMERAEPAEHRTESAEHLEKELSR